VEHSSHISFKPSSTRFSLAAVLVVALFIAGTVRRARAQTNTALGTGALSHNTTGDADTAIGWEALFNNTTGGGNTALGIAALQNNATANFNTALGGDALEANTTGTNNVATGSASLFSNTTGGQNTATGNGALEQNTTGDDNVAVGYTALVNNTKGVVNVATGSHSLQSNTTGSGNTAVGGGAAGNLTTGSGNIAIGNDAGDNLTTGYNNIDIGNEGIAGESGIIRIGTKGTQTRTFIAGISGTSVFIGSPVLVNANGKIGIPVSSARYKRDIQDMGEASERLMKLRPVTFRYKEDSAGTLQYGLVAEEVAQVYPELVTYGDDGKPLSVAYQMLPAMLLNELQKEMRESRRKDTQIAELQKQVEALQKETARIDALTARLSALEQQARTARPERLTAATR
jgi:hypothetical protein